MGWQGEGGAAFPFLLAVPLTCQGLWALTGTILETAGWYAQEPDYEIISGVSSLLTRYLPL